jgi:exopolysaccharide production protein ExoQ
MYGRWSGEIMWTGVTQQKNGLGRLCLISVFFLAWTLWIRWQRRDAECGKYQTAADVFLLGLSVWLLKGPTLQAYSATAVTALCLGLCTFGVLLWGRKRRARWASRIWSPVVALLIAIGVGLPVLGTASAGGYVSAFGRDATLTGRTDIWASLLPVAEQKFFLGHGFGGFWTTENQEAHDVGEAHNGYLDLRLDLGMVGVLFVSMFLLSLCRKAELALPHDFEWASLTICYLVMAVVHNISESSINSLTSHLTAVVLFLSVSLTASAACGRGPGTPREATAKQDAKRG